MTEHNAAADCPFCAGTDIRFDRHISGSAPTGEVWSMCCYDCGATFPNRYRKELLIEKWNTRTLTPVAVSRDTLADKISAKIAQLKHYRDNECQLDHAKTIAEGRISQANQILHWIAEDSLSLPAVAYRGKRWRK